MTKTRILHLVEYLYLGGIERLLQQLSDQTDQSQAELLFMSYETQELVGIGLEMSQKGQKVYTTKKSSGRDWALVRKIQKILKEEKIDVIHTHDFGPMEYAVIAKILNPKIKLVHTQHTLHHFISNKKYTLFFQLASYFYHSIICVSKHVERTVLKHCPYVKKSILKTIPNGVNTEVFHPHSEKSDSETLKLVSISRLSKEKNFDYLLETCAQLKNMGVDFILHHAGTTEDKVYQEQIENFIKSHQLQDSIVLHGYVNQTQKILEMGDYFLSASHTEGHPVAVLEAMSAEKICLVSDIEPHREIAEDSLVFFDKEDPMALAQMLEQLTAKNFKHEQEYRDKKKTARRIIQEKFSIQQMVKNYVDLYC